MSGFRTTSAEDLIVHTLAMTAGGRLIFANAIFPRTPRARIACDKAHKAVQPVLAKCPGLGPASQRPFRQRLAQFPTPILEVSNSISDRIKQLTDWLPLKKETKV
jgi:hypothetical protein